MPLAGRGEAAPRPRRSLGQNFLRARWVARLFAQWASGFRLLLEIGPGTGALTREVLAACRGCMVYGLELDERLLPGLSALGLLSPGLGLVHGDALRPPLRLEAFDAVYGSIPYNITGPLLGLLATGYGGPAMLLLQREVADRLAARPGTGAYGRISVLVQAVYRVRLGPVVPPSAFTPRPRVYSRIVYLEPRPGSPPGETLRALEDATRCMFSGRNKLAAKMAEKCLGVPRAEAERLAGGRRVYQLSPGDFLALLGLAGRA